MVYEQPYAPRPMPPEPPEKRREKYDAEDHPSSVFEIDIHGEEEKESDRRGVIEIEIQGDEK